MLYLVLPQHYFTDVFTMVEEDTSMKEMGKRIHQKRVECDLTLEDLGKMLEVSKSTISKWENGQVEDIPRRHIAKMAEIFRCKPSWIMGMDDVSKVALSYSAQGKETVNVTVDGDPIIGESSLRAKLYQAAVNVRPENLQVAIDLLNTLA